MLMAPKTSPNTIASNKRARFEYHLHDEFEAGVQLAGWEVKALRAGRVQLTDSFVTLHRERPICTAVTLIHYYRPRHMWLQNPSE